MDRILRVTDQNTIDVVIDVVCPWCFVGKRTLEKAITNLDLGHIPVRYHPFQLSAETPQEGVGRDAYYEKKFGNSPQFQKSREYLVERGKTLDIAFNYAKDGLIANTLDAHRVIYWAQSAPAGTQSRLADLIMQAYFEDVAFIGAKDILVACAKEAGMDSAIVSDLLESDRDVEAVKTRAEYWRTIGVTGVPFTILKGRVGIAGAVEVEEFERALHQYFQ